MILCPVDFSFATTALVQTAAALARAEAAPALLLLHVLPAGTDEAAAASAHLIALAAPLRATGLPVQTELRTGCPGPAFTQFAAESCATTIVLGAHGTGGVSRFLMGSTAETVLRTAPCATLLLKGE